MQLTHGHLCCCRPTALQSKCASLLLQVNDCKHRISELKALIQQRRVQQSMASLTEGAAEQAADPEEERAKAQIEQASRYSLVSGASVASDGCCTPVCM